jgi:pentatricopeptide repeat protein
LKACASLGFLRKGKEIHDEITSRKLLEKDIVLGNAAVDMYAKCGMLDKAQELLEELPVRDIVSWNAIISGYADQGQGCKALNCFDQMQAEGLSPGVVTFIATLKACGSVGAVDKGIKLHDEILQKRLLEKNVVLGNALVDMYAKCGALGKAQKVLEGIHIRNVVSWNALIAGHVLQGNNHKALDCFRWMQSEGLVPDTVTFICILKACGSTGAIDLGKHIHNDLVRRGLLGRDIVLGNALVDMYAKCGLLAKAQELLEELPIHDVVSWNVLIAGYANQGQCHEVLQCFEQMQSEGLSPDVVTFICILKVCGTVGAIDQGKQIHETISTRGLLKKDMVLGNALVDMYAKCGLLAKAQEVLENELPQQNVVSWSSLITGYAQQGQGHEAMNHFKKMQIKGLSPDEITFLCVLSACSNSGLSDEAESLFAHMTKTYGLTPRIQHHIWMILVLGYGGYFDKAVSVIKVMPRTDCPALWLALLGACRKWGNVMFGALAFDHITQLDSACATAYVLMGNIFASAGMQEDAEKVKSMIPKHHVLPQNVYLTL